MSGEEKWVELEHSHDEPWARCDGCGKEVEFPGAEKTMAGVEAAMRAAGWRVGPPKKPGDRCPDCVKAAA